MPNALQKWIHKFLAWRPVSILLSRITHRADAFLLRLTSGRYTFAGLVGLPIAQLTMKGAKTGQLRTLALAGIPDDNKLVLIATNFGQKHNPAWYYNLKAHPDCEVTFHDRSLKYVARETQGDEYKRYWQLALMYYAGYKNYKERAAPRPIPILVLEPKKE